MNESLWLTAALTTAAFVLGFRIGIIWEITREHDEIATERQALHDEYDELNAALDSKARATDDDFPEIVD